MKKWKRSILLLSIAVLLLSITTFITNCRRDAQIKEAVQQLNDIQENQNKHLVDFNQMIYGYKEFLEAVLEKYGAVD